jgi:hypothetical protein
MFRALAVRLEAHETQRAQLTRELAAFDDRRKATRVDPRRIERGLRKRRALQYSSTLVPSEARDGVS